MSHWYRETVNLIEAAQSASSAVSIDNLDAPVKADILDMVLGPNAPKAFDDYWMQEHGSASFNETYVAQFLFGSENLSKKGQYDGKSIIVSIVLLDPSSIDNTDRSVSDNVVGKYAAMSPETAPPVLVVQTSKGWRIIEGGHRIAAAKARGDQTIRAVDVSPFFQMSVEDWEEFGF